MRVVRLKQVISMTGLGRSTVYKLMATGRFPKSINLGCSSVGWVEAEIVSWINGRVELRVE